MTSLHNLDLNNLDRNNTVYVQQHNVGQLANLPANLLPDPIQTYNQLDTNENMETGDLILKRVARYEIQNTLLIMFTVVGFAVAGICDVSILTLPYLVLFFYLAVLWACIGVG